MIDKIHQIISDELIEGFQRTKDALRDLGTQISLMVEAYEKPIIEAEKKRPGFRKYLIAKNKRQNIWDYNLRIIRTRPCYKRNRRKLIKDAKRYILSHKRPTPIIWPK